MQDHVSGPDVTGPFDFLLQDFLSHGIGFRLQGIRQIDDVGAVNDDVLKGIAVFLPELLPFLYAQLLHRCAERILGSSGIEHEGIGII